MELLGFPEHHKSYGKRLVALGRSHRYAYEENGKHYVTFENETYEVTGVIGNEGSDYSDNLICIR